MGAAGAVVRSLKILQGWPEARSFLRSALLWPCPPVPGSMALQLPRAPPDPQPHALCPCLLAPDVALGDTGLRSRLEKTKTAWDPKMRQGIGGFPWPVPGMGTSSGSSLL